MDRFLNKHVTWVQYVIKISPEPPFVWNPPHTRLTSMHVCNTAVYICSLYILYTFHSTEKELKYNIRNTMYEMLHQKHGPARTCALTNWLFEEDEKPLKCNPICNIPAASFCSPLATNLSIKINEDWNHVADLRAFPFILTTAATVTISFTWKMNKKTKKKDKSCILRLFQYSLYTACSISCLLQAYCRFPLIFVMVQWFERDWPKGSFWCWDRLGKALGTQGKARTRNSDTNQPLDIVPLCSLISQPTPPTIPPPPPPHPLHPPKPQILQDPLFLEGPLTELSVYK